MTTLSRPSLPGIHILSDRAMLVVSSHLGLEQPNITNVTNCLLQRDYRQHVLDWVGEEEVIVLFRTPSSRAILSILGGISNPKVRWQGEIGAAAMGDSTWANELRFWPCQDWYPFHEPEHDNNPLGLSPSDFDSVWDAIDAGFSPMLPINLRDMTPRRERSPKLIFCPGSQPDLHPFYGNSFQNMPEQSWALSNWELLTERHKTPQEWAGNLPVVFLSAASGTTAIRICLAGLGDWVHEDPFEHLTDVMKETAPNLFRKCKELVEENIIAKSYDPRAQTPNTMNAGAWDAITSGDYESELLALDENIFESEAAVFNPNLMLIVHAASENPFEPNGSCPFGDKAAPLYAIMAHRVLHRLRLHDRLLFVHEGTWNVKKVLPCAPNSARVLLSRIERDRPLAPIREDGPYKLGIFSWDSIRGLELDEIEAESMDTVPPVSCVAASYGLPHRRLKRDIVSKLSSQEIARYYRSLASPSRTT